MKKLRLLTGIFLLGLIAAPMAARACPACNEAVSSATDPASNGLSGLTKGFAWSIYLLMGTPYLLFAGLTIMIVRSTRRAQRPPPP